MNNKSYKLYLTLFCLGFISIVSAQKFDKKYTETFKTNKDVQVVIDASNTDIDVTTWNKNEVQINAYIEVEGVSKEEAEKYFNNWQFEALSNKRKVNILSKGQGPEGFKNNFVFFDDMDFDFEMPDIDFSSFETIVLPEMNFDFDFNFDNILIDIDENMGKNGKYDFRWKDDDHDIVITSKEEWEAFKKTKEYKQLKEKLNIDKEKMRKEIAESKEKVKIEMKKAKEELKKIDKQKIKNELAKAKAELKKLKMNFSSDKNEIIINGKTVKIKKRLEIKVPKKATFDLNTRHCRVKLPNTVAIGKVKYGTFIANNLIDGELAIDYSKVTINDLNACTLFLNNVTDAKIASVTNTTLSNNSSSVNVANVNEDVIVTDKFGLFTVENFNPNFGNFIINLSQSEAILLLKDVPSKFKYGVNKVKLNNKATKNPLNATSTNFIKVNGEYSTITIK
ncbi:hypothetical protein [Polaribacter sp. P097]|uniref:hypothetical protein n=1 Tax=Polaribacter sp. P097 TaxID=3117398 RepID=UPI002FDFF181